MEYVYMLSRTGRPLMPAFRKNQIQKIIKRGKARAVEHVPVVIQLKYDTPA